MTSRFSLLMRQAVILAAVAASLGWASPVMAQKHLNDEPNTDLASFIEKIKNDNPDELRGVFVYGKFAYPVTQQPWDNSLYVSNQDEVVTQYRSAAHNGVTGLLAHNYLAGASFYELATDDEIHLVFGDGSIKVYVVAEILQYQAMVKPEGYFFKDVKSGEDLSSRDLYNKVYDNGDKVTLQTCIQSGTNSTWGRLFVVAYPADPQSGR